MASEKFGQQQKRPPVQGDEKPMLEQPPQPESRVEQLNALVRSGSPRLKERARALAAEYELRYTDALEQIVAEENGTPPAETYRVRETGRAFVNGGMTTFPKGMLITPRTHGPGFYLRLAQAGVKLDAVQH